MKRLSIGTKLVIWFSIALVVVAAASYVAVLGVGNQLLQKSIRDNLIETVESNVSEISYWSSLEDLDLDTQEDYFLPYVEGFLEIDVDFLGGVNQVYTALYQEDGSLLYGENPIARESSALGFVDAKIQTLKVQGTTYYVFDRKLTKAGLDSLWLRGVVAETQGNVELWTVAKLSLLLLPFIVLVGILGGYLVAKRTLRPLHTIAESAQRISRGQDLEQRIDVGEGTDELHQLADSFNRMFERLYHAFNVERQFIADASHELRTPLSVLLAQCELALEEDSDPAEYREALLVTQRQGKKMAQLVEDMLDLTRLDLKRDQYEKNIFSLSELVEGLCQDMALLQDQHITLTYAIQLEVDLQGNPQLMARLLTNLITNAYRYGREEGHIHVTLTQQEEGIFLTVADDGMGMDETTQQQIFQRFYQGDASRGHQGSGLGLAMAQDIAAFHEGQITVESTLGEGSTFTCFFPL